MTTVPSIEVVSIITVSIHALWAILADEAPTAEQSLTLLHAAVLPDHKEILTVHVLLASVSTTKTATTHKLAIN